MNKIVKEALTYDDVLLIPGASSFTPNMADLTTRLSKDITLNVPLVSAAMDTVTEARMAIAIAREGGIGIIHKNMSVEKQVEQIDRVKRSEHGVITDPFYLHPECILSDAVELMSKYRISGVPIVDADGKAVDYDWEVYRSIAKDATWSIEFRWGRQDTLTVIITMTAKSGTHTGYTYTDVLTVGVTNTALTEMHVHLCADTTKNYTIDGYTKLAYGTDPVSIEVETEEDAE